MSFVTIQPDALVVLQGLGSAMNAENAAAGLPRPAWSPQLAAKYQH